MKLFVDTADPVEIREALNRGIVGVTTNPSLLSKQPGQAIETLRSIVTEIAWSGAPLSVELTATEFEAQRAEARWVFSELQYEHVAFKVAIGWDDLQIIRRLKESGHNVNVTACMTTNQAVLAANAGARYVSLFWNRILDGGDDPYAVVFGTRNVLNSAGSSTEIIVGSIRKPEDVERAFWAGAHIVTVPPAILRQMAQHPETDKIIEQFTRDAAVLNSPRT